MYIFVSIGNWISILFDWKWQIGEADVGKLANGVDSNVFERLLTEYFDYKETQNKFIFDLNYSFSLMQLDYTLAYWRIARINLIEFISMGHANN